jgi:hypothetical protein
VINILKGNRMKILIIVPLLLFIMVLQIEGYPKESKFQLSDEPPLVLSPQRQLGIGVFVPAVEVVGFDRRQPNIKAPGDYYRYPRGAKK